MPWSTTRQILTGTLAVVGTSAALAWLAVIELRRQKKNRRYSVGELLYYPVKSCAEVSAQRAVAGLQGFEKDRRFQVVDASKDMKFCTPRDERMAKLFHIRADLTEDSLLLRYAPNDLHLGVLQGRRNLMIDLKTTTTTGKKAQVLCFGTAMLQDYGDEAAKWMEDVLGEHDMRLMGIGAGYARHVKENPSQGNAVPETDPPCSLADEAPYLLANPASLEDLNRRLEDRGSNTIDMRRFRPNIVVKDLRPWEEDTWRKIRIGKAEFWVWQRAARCGMTTVDTDTLQRNTEPLKTLSSFRERAKGCRNFGMHVVPVSSSFPADGSGLELEVGQEVEVLEYDEERRAEWLRLFGNWQARAEERV